MSIAPAELETLPPELGPCFAVLLQYKLQLTLHEQIENLEQRVRKDLARPEKLRHLQSLPAIAGRHRSHAPNQRH
jgi:hypothetical protein